MLSTLMPRYKPHPLPNIILPRISKKLIPVMVDDSYKLLYVLIMLSR